MTSQKTTARLAGFLYFLLVLTGIFYLVYAPSQFIVWEDASATVKNILDNKLLFRVWIFIGIISSIIFLLLPLVLYRLFESVDKTIANLMVMLVAVSIPISISYTINLLDILTLLSDAVYLEAFQREHIHSQVMLAFKSYFNGMSIVRVFWGLWLFPFGYLAYKSNYLPKILSVSLMLGCFSYLIKFSAGILFPSIDIPSFVGYPSSFGEIGSCLWLLVMGIKPKHPSIVQENKG